MKIKFDQKFVAMQRIYNKKTNKRISQQKLEATNTEGLSDELRQRLVAVWKDLEQHVIDSAIDQSVATSAQSVCPCKGWTL